MPIIRADVGKSNSAERRYAADALLSFPAPKAPAFGGKAFLSHALTCLKAS